ncbi:MAG: LPS export ABC transporter periplasmic protein LptC [Thermotogae bacterium]|nr:LPS export ABC transporter periplasmic protein LptC [Thermotogota bacterium]
MRYLPLLLFLFGCSKSNTPKEDHVEPGADSVRVISTKMGRKLWMMKTAKVKERGDTLIGYGVSITFFKGNRAVSILTADSGKYDQTSGNMVAFGRVHLISSDSTELWSRSLHWDEKKKIIWTEDSVKIYDRKRERILYAKGLETDASISYIKFKSPVRGEGEEEFER